MERDVAEATGTPAPNPRAALAAFLSFIFPGLGQAYNRQSGLAWLLAVPILILVGAAAIVGLLGPSRLLARFFDVRFLVGLIVLDLVLLAWRLVAVVQAHGRRERPSSRSWASWVTAVLVIGVLAMHVLPAYYAAKAIDTLGAVALGGTHGGNLGDILPESIQPEPSDQPDLTAGDRVNILLVGIDSLPSRTTRLTDTMLVVSLDPRGARSAMISVPRDLYGMPLPGGGVFNEKLNSLMVRAAADPAKYPLGGVGTLKATIGGLLGIKINYFAAINLLGFKQTVDSIGGVDITVKRTINDPTYYDEFDRPSPLYIKVGTYHMNGHMALAFVRSRKGVGDSDFTRADRQQQLLEAVRAKLTAGNLLLALPGLLDAVKNTIATDVPANRLAELARAIQDADMSQLQRIVLQPPVYMSVDAFSKAGYILIPKLDAIRAIGEQLLTGATPQPTVGP
ncbi:MAG: LCP family glycopolymer transferase [Candidatus Limnocylindria bacterium]